MNKEEKKELYEVILGAVTESLRLERLAVKHEELDEKLEELHQKQVEFLKKLDD